MSTKKKTSGWWWVGGVALVVLAVLAFRPSGWLRASAVTKLRGQTVQRGPLEISVVQRGNLAAKDSVSVVSEIEGTTTVLFLIKEGTFVKEGDLLVELDGSQIVEKKLGQEISYQNADASLKKAKAQYDIQLSQNESDIEAALRKLTFAKIDQKKYLEGDLPQQTEEAKQSILLAEQEQKQAETTYTWSKGLNEKGFVTRTELDRDELAYARTQVDLSQAKLAKTILEDFEDPRKQAELDANVKEAERGLERANLKALAQIADVDANLKSCEAKYKLEKEKLEKYVAQLDKTKIKASTSGMVVYTRGEGGRMGNDQPMQEGAQVRERQEILQIPRAGGMIVEASIHESVLKQVAIGLPASIRVDAAPGKQFLGKVTFVALLPDKGSWWANPNQRLYKTELQIERPAPGSEDALKELRPGMSCSIEIFSSRIEDALFVPLQSVFVDKGESIAFVTKGDDHERRVLTVGRSNEKFVQVVEGLKEGEEVLLAAPPGFSPSGSEDKHGDAAVNEFRTLNGANGAAPGAGAPSASGAAPNAPNGMPGAVRPDAAGGEGAAPGGERPRGPRREGGGPRREGGGARRDGGATEGGSTPGATAPATEGTPAPAGDGAKSNASETPGGDAKSSASEKPADDSKSKHALNAPAGEQASDG